MDANPRLGLAPTIPMRIFLFVAMHASLISGACSYRCTGSIMIPSGPRMKASRKPGLRVSGPIAISARRVRSQSSNGMLRSGPTTPQDYPERSGFAPRRERECGHRRH